MRLKRFQIYGIVSKQSRRENLPEKRYKLDQVLGPFAVDSSSAVARWAVSKAKNANSKQKCMHKMRLHRSGVGVEFIDKFASGLFDSFSKSIVLHNSRWLCLFTGFLWLLSSTTWSSFFFCSLCAHAAARVLIPKTEFTCFLLLLLLNTNTNTSTYPLRVTTYSN